MAVFAQDWLAVPPGAIYPVEYRAGDACPAGLEDDARALGLLAEDAPAEAGKRGKGRPR